jgi:hypothetical protein
LRSRWLASRASCPASRRTPASTASRPWFGGPLSARLPTIP